MAKQKANYLM